MDFIQVFDILQQFLETLVEFTYNAIFYQVNILGLTFPLWSIFAVLGIGVFIIALVVKILI